MEKTVAYGYDVGAENAYGVYFRLLKWAGKGADGENKNSDKKYSILRQKGYLRLKKGYEKV